MRSIEYHIQWLVVIVVVFATTWEVIRYAFNIMGLGLINGIVTYLNLFFILLLLFFQNRYYGLKIWGKPFFLFFLAYCMYVLADMTIYRKYPLDEMLAIPKSVFVYFRSLFLHIGYFLCAETILYHFNIRKFVVVSAIVCTIPSLIYIQDVGVDTIQMGLIGHGDEDFLSNLTIGFTNSPIIVICLFYWNRLFSNKMLSILFCTIVTGLIVYIFIATGKRGPILWTIVNVMICLYLTKRKKIKSYLLLTFIVSFIMYLNYESIIKGLKEIAPKTGKKIEASITEGDTSNRFDIDDPESSTYLIGLKNFASSPIWGYYFRLVTNNDFRGVYTHNVFIEILMTFLFLLRRAYFNSSFRFSRKYTDNQFAFLILFLSSFLMLQTSRSIVFRIGFWLPFYLLFIMRELSTRRNKLLN